MASLNRFLPGLFIFAAGTAAAQIPMTPLWQHTWSFGQGPLNEYFRPLRNDNHVTVDPITERLHVTIDDSETSVSSHQEFHFQFDLDGNDLTPQPAPLMGFTAPVGPVNGNAYWTKGIAVHGDRVSSIQAYMFNISNGQEYLVSTAPSGLARSVNGRTLDDGWYYENEDHIVTDGSSTVGATRSNCYIFNHEGWVIGEVGGVMDLHEGIVYSVVGASTPAIRRYLISDGSQLPSLPYSTGGYVPQYIVVEEDHIYVLGKIVAGVSAGFRIAKLTMDGTLLWAFEQPMPFPSRVEAMAVDAAGRCWVAYTLGDTEADTQALIAVVASDGVDNALYTYGAGTNSMVRHGDRIYMTGRVSVDSPDTYLAAFGTDITVGTDKPAEEPDFGIFPNPAREQVRIQGRFDERVPVEVHDARGSLVATRLLDSSGMLDVRTLEPGCYFLTAKVRDQRSTRRFMVVR